MGDYKFTNISIEGYRRLFAVNNLELRPLNVLIGANSGGKTSFLEVFSVLAASAEGKLQNALSKLGGLSSLVTCGKTDQVTFKLSLEIPDAQLLHYTLTLDLSGRAYGISQETLVQEQGSEHESVKHIDFERDPFAVSSVETLLSTRHHTPGGEFNEREILRNQLASCLYYSAHALNVGQKSPIRLPQQTYPATHPGSNGETLVSCLYNLRETDTARFEVIEDTLAIAFPGFQSLGFPPVAAGMMTMTWKDEHFSQPLYMHQLSEGTLRFLWLISLLYSPDLTTITLIDEPEVSLHPQLLSILRDVMREASKRTQLIVATHSDRLIRFLEPSEVLVLDSEEGLTQLTWADSLDLEVWLQEYTLDELWRMGQLGGRP